LYQLIAGGGLDGTWAGVGLEVGVVMMVEVGVDVVGVVLVAAGADDDDDEELLQACGEGSNPAACVWACTKNGVSDQVT
jgi:hypothetical protein